MTNTPLPLRSLPARLGREWSLLSRRPAAVRRARTWDLGIGTDIASLDEVVSACGLRTMAERLGDRPDQERVAREEEVLRRLVVLARHDDLAARVVLQRMLPGLVSAARRWGLRRGDGADLTAFDDLLTDAWEVIRTYPVERRPQQLAAQLLRDSEYRAFIRAGRRLMVVEPVADEHLDGVAPEAGPTAIEELASIVADAQLTDHDRRLLGMLVDGRSTLEVASVLRVSERTVRNHKDAMVHRLRAAV